MLWPAQDQLLVNFPFFAPARSAGASYSETGVSNDLGVRCSMSVRPRPEKTGKTPNGICVGVVAFYEWVYFSVDFQGA